MTEYETYKKYLEDKHGRKIANLETELDGEYVNLKYKFEKVPFNRIRRITGYCTASVDTWNNAKKAELADRVKHGLGNMEKI